MFQSLRIGTPLYVLHKNELSLKTGEVVSVSPPRPQNTQNYAIGVIPPQQTVIDVEVNIDGQNVKIPNLLTSLTITDCDNGVVVSDSRDAMFSEISILRNNSQKVIDSVGQHEEIVRKCNILLEDLNPQVKIEAERSQEIAGLKSDVNGMKDDMTEIKGMLSKLLNKK